MWKGEMRLALYQDEMHTESYLPYMMGTSVSGTVAFGELMGMV